MSLDEVTFSKSVKLCRNGLCGCAQEFFFGGGSTNSVEDRVQRERRSVGGSPLVRGSGESCNLVKKFLFI